MHYASIERFKSEFHNWTSGNSIIDEFIQNIQLEAKNFSAIIEWIPFNKFTNIKYLSRGGFGTVFKAIWTDGFIVRFDEKKNDWRRNPQVDVCLKSLHNSANLRSEFLKEVENQHKYGGTSAITIYGITKDPNDDNYTMVMEYAKQGSLRKLLDSKYYDFNWKRKVATLCFIAGGLNKIHEAGLMHKDFHSGNIVITKMFNSRITDFGLCKPVSQDLDTKGVFGVLPYVAPEVLCEENYTLKSDIYSFGIIMSEVFTGYPPYYDIEFNQDLAIQICNGRRPEIKREVSQLLLDLMNRCLNSEPQKRPTAKELLDVLKQYLKDLNEEETELYKQVETIENSTKNLVAYQANSIRLNYQTCNIYTSKHLNFQELSKPTNTDFISTSMDFVVAPDDI